MAGLEGNLGSSQPNCAAADEKISENSEIDLIRNEEPFLRDGTVKENTIVGSVTEGDEMVSEKAHVEPLGSDRDLGDLSSFVEAVDAEKVDSHGNNNSVKLGAESPRINDAAGNNGISLITETASDNDKSEESDDSDEESDSASESSSSSSSKSEDDDEEEDTKSFIHEQKVKNKESAATEKTSDAEEGEIILSDDADEMVAWSDDEDGEGNAVPGPIKSKNEVQVLPPIPSVNVALQPHHQTQPIGTILSMIGCQVIVEGNEKHAPLGEGSILWITETRLPLGIVDEIFGPVKNPYYIVRYNSENEVPEDIQQGTPISYVAEFASHVLGDENLYKKGYDASNEYDEELFEDAEFSDDEKEAEYRKTLKMKKRGKSDSKPVKGQRENQTKTWKQNQDRGEKNSQHQERSSSSSSGIGQNRPGNQPMFLHQQAQTLTSTAVNGSWPFAIAQPSPQGLNLPNGLPPNGMLWMQQNPTFPLYQTPPLQANPMFPQQINSIPGLPSNFNPQLNCGNVPPIPPWSVGLDPNLVNFLQLLQIGLQSQNAPTSSPMGGESTHSSTEISPPIFNQGRGGGGRGGGHHRGRGRGRGRLMTIHKHRGK